MSFTIEQLTVLEEAIAQGATSVKYQDKEVHYQSLHDMLMLRDLMRRSLNISNAESTRVYSRFDKGL